MIEYLDDQKDIMEDMMEDMEEIQNTGNVNLDFLYGMIPHHESAVEMSESYIKYANDDSEFTQLAKDIIDAQEKEIKEMKSMISRLKENVALDEATERLYLEEYNTMMQSHKNHSTGGENLDLAFAKGMTMHHQMAVDMAKAIEKYSDDEEIIQFAQNIIKVQEEEITQMQTFINDSSSSSHQ